MQFLAILIAIIGGGAFWWWRMKMVGEAASEIHDAAGRAIGKYKRYKFRRKVEDSPHEAVDDPVAAAVVMMYAIAAQRNAKLPLPEEAIRREVSGQMGIAKPDEVLVFGKWVASHSNDPNNLVLRYAKLWNGALTVQEREDFVASLERVATAQGPLLDSQRVTLIKLRERLGLVNDR